MKVFRDLIFRLKYGDESDIEKLMKNREEIRAEIKSLMKKKREIETRIDKVLAAQEETRKRVEKQMEMEKKGRKQRAGKAGEKTGILGKTGILRRIGGKQDQGSGKKIPEKDGKKPEIRKKKERKKEEIFLQEGTEDAKKVIDSEVEEAAELMAETIIEAELEAGLKTGGKTEANPGERSGVETEAKTETGVETEARDKKTPSGKTDKFSALFSSQISPENEDDSEKTTKDEKGKDGKTSADFFGADLLEELLNDDSLNEEEEQSILKFIEDTSTEELISGLRDVREKLFIAGS
ncbi:hypothetical protein MSMTP_2279 [Methanosarcina sp. MTP4]|uniref:hypothetical protein n=1 Tax=Methanosarcina sp. MTP4 TaxID=1434100 RepID=UPI000615E3A8|nr:hypothetical protein [Methanosarcina sp. MTP4]AKB25748.1 hypothetical protein MSMTP_2279 [Methanosarcina sp. MTP4]